MPEMCRKNIITNITVTSDEYNVIYFGQLISVRWQTILLKAECCVHWLVRDNRSRRRFINAAQYINIEQWCYEDYSEVDQLCALHHQKTRGAV